MIQRLAAIALLPLLTGCPGIHVREPVGEPVDTGIADFPEYSQWIVAEGFEEEFVVTVKRVGPGRFEFRAFGEWDDLGSPVAAGGGEARFARLPGGLEIVSFREGDEETWNVLAVDRESAASTKGKLVPVSPKLVAWIDAGTDGTRTLTSESGATGVFKTDSWDLVTWEGDPDHLAEWLADNADLAFERADGFPVRLLGAGLPSFDYR